MTTVQVLEFSSVDPVTGEAIWPPQNSQTVAVPGNVSTSPGTVLFAISADADCRLGVTQAAQTYSTPILSAISNEFRTGSGAGERLYFV